MVPDSSILAAAKALPQSRRALADLREFTGRASRSELDRWWSAIERGLTTDQLPAVPRAERSPPPPRAWSMRNPEADARLRLARAGIIEVAEQIDMPVENLLTPDPPAPRGVASARGADRRGRRRSAVGTRCAAVAG
jgi:ribonuclease D